MALLPDAEYISLEEELAFLAIFGRYLGTTKAGTQRRIDHRSAAVKAPTKNTSSGQPPARNARDPLEYDPYVVNRLISLAHEKDVHAHGAVRDIAADLIERGQPLHTELGKFSAEFLRHATIPTARGQKDSTYRSRNYLINEAVTIAERHGYGLTRNPAAKDHSSACSIVARILNGFGVTMTEGAIAAIVRKARRA